jgi:hypothetical protein
MLSVAHLLVEQFLATLDAALPQVGALVIVTLLAVVLAIVLRSGAAPAPHALAVGDRARDHAVLLAELPRFSHPDARGHARPRAPGVVLPVS